MNIEEERKAFETAFQVPPKLEFDPEQEIYITSAPIGTWLYNSCSVMNIRFQGWLAAKKHAKEMAKSAVTISETMGDKFGLYDERSNRAFKSFATAEEARVWATNNGYRVIEE